MYPVILGFNILKCTCCGETVNGHEHPAELGEIFFTCLRDH